MNALFNNNIEYRGFRIEAHVRVAETNGSSHADTVEAGFTAELQADDPPLAVAEEFLRRYPTGRFAMSFGTLRAPQGERMEAWARDHVLKTAKGIIDALLRTLAGWAPLLVSTLTSPCL